MNTKRSTLDDAHAGPSSDAAYRSKGRAPDAAALTVLPAHVTGSDALLSALTREFARLRTLEHPNIGRLFDLVRHGERYYVTAERLDGESLRVVLDHLAPERLEPAEADEIVRAVGSALIYAHERGIAHGGVRAENVVVTMDRRFVLTNFLGRRVAKVAARPATPADDVRGLVKLAAELYTGSTSGEAVRSAPQGRVAAARLRAIRAMLDAAPSRRAASVATFLAAAGLQTDDERLAPTDLAHRDRPLASPRAPWWRVAVPVAAVAAIVAIGGMLASYQAAGGDWRARVLELKVLGLETLRTVSARRTEDPPADAVRGTAVPVPLEEPAPAEPAPAEPAAAEPAPAPSAEISARATVEGAAGEPSAPKVTTPAPVVDDAAPLDAAANERTATAALHAAPSTLALVPATVAAREDHSAVSIEVVREGDARAPVTVVWWTTPGTAKEYDDYIGFGRQTVTLPAGATRVSLLIPIVNDGIREADESFTVRVARAQAGAGAVSSARITLHDDD